VILEAEVRLRDARDFDRHARCLRDALNEVRKIVRSRQAVADEQHGERGSFHGSLAAKRLGRGDAERRPHG
jgi:hypothetical protein